VLSYACDRCAPLAALGALIVTVQQTARIADKVPVCVMVHKP
jgi:hypothetical protein